MPKDLKSTDPKRFGLTSFADLLAPQSSIPGQDPDTFEAVREGIFASLAPTTPYECLLAENLVSIDWELLQHRRMRDDLLRQEVFEGVSKSIVAFEKKKHDAERDKAWARHVESGGTEEDWVAPSEFESAAAQKLASDLVSQAQSSDAANRKQAQSAIQSMGINLTDILSCAYLGNSNGSTTSIARHADEIVALEKRRREVLRDFGAILEIRPIEAEVIEG